LASSVEARSALEFGRCGALWLGRVIFRAVLSGSGELNSAGGQNKRGRQVRPAGSDSAEPPGCDHDYRERPDTRLLTGIDFSETAVGPS
jgi:hypothetical protein